MVRVIGFDGVGLFVHHADLADWFEKEEEKQLEIVEEVEEVEYVPRRLSIGTVLKEKPLR